MDKETLLNITYTQYEKIFDKYSKSSGLINPHKVAMRKGLNEVDAFVIRCNEMYVTNDIIRNNDYLVLLQYLMDSISKYVFKVTADPSIRRYNIANLCEQIYYGNIRNHRWIAGRICIAQDKCPVRVRRYSDSRHYIEEVGYFGINIHDNGGLWNSSLGCVILESKDSYNNFLKPLLKSAANKNYVPVTVIRDKDFLNLMNAA